MAQISCSFCPIRPSFLPRRNSFVRFSSAEEAANAINNMYGQTIGNKTLLCKLSHGIPQNNATPSDNLYIKPLLDMTSEADLLALFSPFGRVLECKVMLDKNTGQSRQIGFVRFATIEEATKALAANNGRYLTDDAPPMVVKYAESRSQKIARRAKLLANQVAAESRRNNALKYQHIPTGEDLEIGAEVTADAVAHDADATQGGPGASSSAAPASMPYIVKDEYGNVTFAPEPEQVESAAQAAPAPTNNYWNGRANGQGHYEGGGRGGRRGGGPRSSHRPRASYQPYHPSETDGAADDTDHAPVHVPHHNHAVYRKKGHAGNNAAAASNGDHSAAGANASAPSHHHQAPHHRSSHPRWTLPTFHNSPTPRVQLAGKVEVGQNGELSAPDWADDPTRLFVSHLPLDYEASELQALFEVHGTVTSAKISQDKRSVRPKTYGFVQLATPEAAAKAVKEMHGTMVDGRPINVAFEATLSVAKQRNESDPYYRMAPNAGPHHLPAGGRGPHRGRGGRGPRGAVPYQPTYYQAPYMGEAGEAPPPYMYMIDPATGMPYPYPVYFPSVPVSYIPEVAHAEPYYPSTGVSAQNAESS